MTFYGGEGDRLIGRYIAHVSGGQVASSRVLPQAEQVPLTPLQLRMAKARSIGPGPDFRPCTNAAFNAAIVPPASLDAPLEMYLTSAQTDANVYPLGGHYLLSLAPDGRLLSVRKFTNSCLNMERPRGGGRRGEPAALFVSHLLDPIPTEIHVFMALSSQAAPASSGSATRTSVWVVTGDGIGQIPMPAEPPRSRRRN